MARLLALALLLLSADAVLVTAQVPAARALATAPTEFAEPVSSVSQMVELRDGRVLLYDTREKRFGVADFGDGSFREVARQGKGPLEYSSVTALLRLPGDSIWMWDLGNARTMTLAPDGQPVRTDLLTDGTNPMAMLGKPIATEIAAAKKFWPAEDYHQNFWQSQEKMLTFAGYKPRAEHYKYYREGCGRDARLKEVWGSEALQGVAGH